MNPDQRNIVIVRAGLDKSPEVILVEWQEQQSLVASRRAAIEQELRSTNVALNFFKWRLSDVLTFLDIRSDAGSEEAVVATITSLVLLAIAGGVYAALNYLGVPVLTPLALLALPCVFAAAVADRSSSFSSSLRSFWRRLKEVFNLLSIVFLFPWLFILDRALHTLDTRRWRREDQLQKELKELSVQDSFKERLSPSEIVTQTYLQGLGNIKEECLGPSSKVRRSQRDLLSQLETIATQREQVKARLNAAAGDEERSAPLWQARERLKEREEKITKAQQELDQFIASTQAFFAECEARVRKIGYTMDDAELLKQIDAGAERDEALLAQNQQAIQQTLQGLNERLQSFMVSANQLSAPPAYTDGAALLEDWIEQTEAAAKRIADIRSLYKTKNPTPSGIGFFRLHLQLSH